MSLEVESKLGVKVAQLFPGTFKNRTAVFKLGQPMNLSLASAASHNDPSAGVPGVLRGLG